ncbi:hypothetical protein RT723_06450 [Psychrosphaera aquimarina]|uniref:Uncharacterized protein n=1 Tax=Psychrosphaera aquimarina TaxID=2044854 RepID=A0ABU3QYY2_9GAMM|nr:hypothetical protein [Psychrosphaera aquimarina]MDU0112648.1 hypothetical protein [Psychrosphaera aquimarina]
MTGRSLPPGLDLPEGPHLATAIFAHCFTCGKDIPAARRIAARLSAIGIAVLRFDFTGLGHSRANLPTPPSPPMCDDLIAANGYLERRDDDALPDHRAFSGRGGRAQGSCGPWITSRLSRHSARPSIPEHVTHNFAEALPEIASNGVAEVSLGGRPFRIGKGFIEDVAKGQLHAINRLAQCRPAGPACAPRRNRIHR